MTKIEWAEEVWNPTIGCSLIAPGCKNCYAMRDAYRKQFHPNPRISEAYAGLTQLTNGHPVWTGKVNLMEDRLSIPLRKRKPTTWFVDSMSDLFHADVPDAFIDRVFAAMSLCPQHRFIILTKRWERMAQWFAEQWQGRAPIPELKIPEGPTTGRDFVIEQLMLDEAERRGMIDVTNDSHWEPDGTSKVLAQFHWPLPNVILGASASDQATIDAAAPHLMRTPAACRVLSLEPLLGPVTSIPKVDWVIVGGESGTGARPMPSAWVRSIRDQCRAAGVAFFFKQWGEYLPDDQKPPYAAAGEVRVGRKAAGRLLDGREWSELPEVLR